MDSKSSKKHRATSVLEGSGTLIDEFLGCPEIGKPPHYRHKKAMQLLCVLRPKHSAGSSLLSRLVSLISRNCDAAAAHYTANPSKENWRFTHRTEISSENSSPEVTLERAIVQCMAPDFANQVPTASGLAGPNVDKTRNVDLVRRTGEGCYEFIELKVGSDTPVMAAFEIYSNAAIYACYRAVIGPTGNGTSKQPILFSSRIALRTLAPRTYYGAYNLRWLETLLNRDIEMFREEQVGPSAISDFSFLAFPVDFDWPSSTRHSETDVSLRDAVTRIERLYG